MVQFASIPSIVRAGEFLTGQLVHSIKPKTEAIKHSPIWKYDTLLVAGGPWIVKHKIGTCVRAAKRHNYEDCFTSNNLYITHTHTHTSIYPGDLGIWIGQYNVKQWHRLHRQIMA